MKPKNKEEKPAWVRDGTIMSGRDLQIDLRCGRYSGRDTVWLTIKARNEIAEKTATRLLELLNGTNQ